MWWDLEMTPRGSEVILSCAPRWAHHTSSDMQVILILIYLYMIYNISF